MALLIFLVLVIGDAYLALPWIIGAVARDRLAATGFAPVSLDVAGVGLEEVRIRESGCDGYLPKLTRISALIEKIEEHLK